MAMTTLLEVDGNALASFVNVEDDAKWVRADVLSEGNMHL
jgi:hypothetical protein